MVICTTKDGLKGKRDTNTMPQWADHVGTFVIFKEEDGYVPLRAKSKEDSKLLVTSRFIYWWD